MATTLFAMLITFIALFIIMPIFFGILRWLGQRHKRSAANAAAHSQPGQ